ncbi:MAG: hypothetical protein M3069_28090 [Chloroflexota bacterium]|nr:hypothetical protein [Chloroflexota bacterium]
MLGAELALRGHRVALIDRDQGQHLSGVFDFYPPGIERLVLGEDPLRHCASSTPPQR